MAGAQPNSELPAALRALQAAARRTAVGQRMQDDAETRLLQTIVEATAILFDAEASSIALFERDPDRLEFKVAAGAQGQGAVGLSVAPSQGIAGYVYSTGEPLALSDVGTDPRFDRGTAERTGYVPRSIAAVPLATEHATVGVLQVLDKRSEPTFSLRDMELLAVFANQAAVAISATRVQRDTPRLIRDALSRIGAEDVTDSSIETLVSESTRALDPAEEAPFWALVDQVSGLRTLTDRELSLVADILEVVARHATTIRPVGRSRLSK